MGAREVEVRDAVAADLAMVAEIYSHESLYAYSTFETEERPASTWEHKLETEDPFGTDENCLDMVTYTMTIARDTGQLAAGKVPRVDQTSTIRT